MSQRLFVMKHVPRSSVVQLMSNRHHRYQFFWLA